MIETRLKARPRTAIRAAAAALALAFAAPAGAQNVLVKMATLVPDGSAWHAILKEMAEEWRTASGGKVTLRIYAGGVAGDDGDVVRKMRLGTLGAGLLSSTGLADIDRSVYALQIPMAYASYEEFDAVLARMTPMLEKALAVKGFVVLNWTDGGWVQFFTKTPVVTPGDLKKLKLFAWSADSASVEIWKDAGFNPVPLPSTEISTALQTGLITALPTTPQAALLLGWNAHVKHMTELNWAVLLGATVITRPMWERIPAEAQPALLASARRTGQRLSAETRRREGADLEAMRARGLNVVHLDAAARELWRQAAEAAYPRVRGGFTPEAAFDQALALRDEFREHRPGAGQ